MEYTPFAGLTALDENDPITIDGASFLIRNPRVIDALLRIGVVTHRHDAHPALANPHAALTGSASTTGGQLSAGTDYALTYTIVDSSGGETAAATPLLLNTGSQVGTPTAAPSAAADYTGGIMPAGGYYYAKTITDGAGGETPISPSVFVYVDPGFASAQVRLSALSFGVPGGGTWRLWRSKEGADYRLVTEGTGDTFLDDGFDPPDNPAIPPEDDTTNQQVAFSVRIPSTGTEPALASGSRIRVYLANDIGFADPSLYAEFPIASAGATFTITQDAVHSGRPPAVSTSEPGAAKINPDTDILDWHWKRPVATAAALPAVGNEQDDARIVSSTHDIYVWTGAVWVNKTSGGGGGGGGSAAADPYGPALGVNKLVSSGGAVIAASGTGSVTVPWPAGLAPLGVNRVVMGLIVSHPDPSHLAAKVTTSGGGTVFLFQPGSFETGDTDLGDPTHPDDPEAFVYFTSHYSQQSGGSNSEYPVLQLENPAGITIPSRRLGYGGGGRGHFFEPMQSIDGVGDGTDLTLTLTSTGASGTIEKVVFYLISSEFDVLLRTSLGARQQYSISADTDLDQGIMISSGIEIDNSTDITLTIIPNMFPPGTTIPFWQVNSGKGNFVAAAGVTLNSKGGLHHTNGQWSRVTLHHRTSDLWVLDGDLS